jgi:predicted ATP-grasp superfamily ATP-dependent carboligase
MTTRVSIPPAIIIGGGEANGLGITRNLGQREIPVYCVTSNPGEVTRYSRYCQGSVVIPDVEQDPMILSQFLRAFHRQILSPGVLFPTTDTALLTVAQLQETIQPYVTFLPSREIVEMMVIKSRFYQSLREHQVPHPSTYLLTSEWFTHTPEITYPVFLRPIQSLPFVQRFGVKGFIAQTNQEVRHYFRLVQPFVMPLMVQEIIPGPPSNGYLLRGYIDPHARPQVLLASRKLRQPTMFSVNTAQVSIPLTEFTEGVQLALQWFRAIGYSGLFGAEFKRDPRDGQLKLLEVNARSQGGNYFGVVCGANHVLAAYHDSLGQALTPSKEYRRDIHFCNLALDLYAFLKMAAQRELTRHDIPAFFRHKHWTYLFPDDPQPFLKDLQRLLHSFLH